MEALDLARIYASHIADQEKAAHKAALEGPREKMQYWIAKLLDCKTLPQMRELLLQFSEMRFSLTDKAAMSTHYTPVAMKLVKSLDDGEKWKWLEDLEELCWKTR